MSITQLRSYTYTHSRPRIPNSISRKTLSHENLAKKDSIDLFSLKIFNANPPPSSALIPFKKFKLIHTIPKEFDEILTSVCEIDKTIKKYFSTNSKKDAIYIPIKILERINTTLTNTHDQFKRLEKITPRLIRYVAKPEELYKKNLLINTILDNLIEKLKDPLNVIRSEKIKTLRKEFISKGIKEDTFQLQITPKHIYFVAEKNCDD